ncbi:hypothetical protein K402DRAFT_425667 [Aulographum hederae CBS 113979]|uniref:Uncharacterized protein n=1 Tax=Aulographum hederae CBS 113979 TaxID=1176131 RepID=A0A6G1GJN5_9PEZI|nr:hypothetical protein K402DRAFT_425667 [Aulographum hederae CBS 113979]
MPTEGGGAGGGNGGPPRNITASTGPEDDGISGEGDGVGRGGRNGGFGRFSARGNTGHQAAVDLQSGTLRLLPQISQPDKSIPHFDGTEVTLFLDDYVNFTITYGLTEFERVLKLPVYCTTEVGRRIRSFPEFEEKDWEMLARALKCEFKEEDSYVRKLSASALEAFAHGSNPTTDRDSKLFYREFNARSLEALKRGLIKEPRRCELLFVGLSSELKKALVTNLSLVANSWGSVEYQTMVRMLHRILEQRSNAREMINETEEERSTGCKVNEAQFSIEKRPETERARVPEMNPESYRPNVAEGMGREIGNSMPREDRFQQPRMVEGSASFNQEIDRLAELFEQMRVSAGDVLSSDFVQKGIQSYDEMEPARKNMSVAAAVLKRIELLSAGSSGAAAQFTSYSVAAGGYDKRKANGQTLFNPITGRRGGRGGDVSYKYWMCGDYAHFQPECPWIQEPTVKRYLVWNTAERKFQHARTGEYVPGYHFRPANTKWEGLMEYLAEDNIAIPSEADMRADERYTQRVQAHPGIANQSQSAPRFTA